MRITKKNMIESQLKPEGITCLDTIDCISKINREDFVPEKYADSSYAEFDIPLGNNYFMLRPITVAKILQLLEIKKSDEIRPPVLSSYISSRPRFFSALAITMR